MTKPTPLAKHVAKAVASADSGAIAKALGALVALRLRKRQRRPEPLQPWQKAIAAELSKPQRQRRSPRRSGRYRAYEVTTKPNFTRTGTWTHHMIAVIKAHTDTSAATRANEACGDPKFASKRLDFNWAADNGYIIWK